MTSDAKIGLLLGLVFIVVIAFLVNGLPKILNQDGGDEVSTTITSEDFDAVVLGEKAEAAVRSVEPVPAPEPRVVVEPRTEDLNDIRFRTSLMPKALTFEPRPTEGGDKTETALLQPVLKPASKTYTVSKGDSLAKIAVKMYGPEKGNTRTVIQRLYEANKDQLKSPDQIIVGQTLEVPRLEVPSVEPAALPQQGIAQVSATNAGALREKLTAPQQTPKPAEKPAEKPVEFIRYTVKSNDTLWKIAQQHLGDGSKYKTIVTLNKDTLRSEDAIYAGMELKLPKQ